jgi:hypothetical protein
MLGPTQICHIVCREQLAAVKITFVSMAILLLTRSVVVMATAAASALYPYLKFPNEII